MWTHDFGQGNEMSEVWLSDKGRNDTASRKCRKRYAGVR